jgi:hypothetical protein
LVRLISAILSNWDDLLFFFSLECFEEIPHDSEQVIAPENRFENVARRANLQYLLKLLHEFFEKGRLACTNWYDSHVVLVISTNTRGLNIDGVGQNVRILMNEVHQMVGEIYEHYLGS